MEGGEDGDGECGLSFVADDAGDAWRLQDRMHRGRPDGEFGIAQFLWRSGVVQCMLSDVGGVEYYEGVMFIWAYLEMMCKSRIIYGIRL